ncbi:MAG: hypothetical protein AAGK02_04690 [Pseudomonadota bacterium]
MALPKLKFPPGLYRNGTQYESMGRYYDADLVRWFEGMTRPIGGWVQKSVGTVTGNARALHTWVDNSSVSRAAIGTHSKLYLMSTAGALTDVTPSGFVAQGADSSTWTLDNGGEDLFGVNDEEGVIYRWQPGDTLASTLSNAPAADSLLHTDEYIVMAFGAGGDPRKVQWSDTQDPTDWTPTAVNFAGDFRIQTGGSLQAGRRIRGGILVWTTEDLHIIRYVGLPDVYGRDRVKEDCGLVSRHGAIVLGNRAYWMSDTKFYMYNGYVTEIPCEIHDDVFKALNKAQKQKVRAVHIAAFNEIWWMYPTTGSENSRIVAYNYMDGTWMHHGLVRLCGIDQGDGFDYPLMVDASGAVWEHETGTTKTGAGTPFVRSGPIDIRNGENLVMVDRVFPDEGTAGDVDVYFHSRYMPNDTETTHGPFAAANPIPVQFQARQVAIELRENVANDWRVGAYRADVKSGGRR